MPLNPPQAYRKTEFTHRRGERLTQPLASDVLTGTLYFVIDEGIIEISDGTNWQVYVGQGANVSNLVNFSYSVATGTPPGANQVRFNAGFPYTAVTRLYFWDITADGQNIKVGLLRLQPGAVIYIQKKNDDTQWASFQLTTDPIDHVTWTELVVVHVNHGLVIGGGQLVLCQAGPGPTYNPPAHAPSHETGGSDAIAHLAGGVIDSGTILTPRLQPGGSNTQVQFNDSSVFNGDSGLTYDKATDTLTAGALVIPTGPISLGTNPSSTALIRLANSVEIRARNAANSADIQGFVIFSDNKVYIGAFANDAGLVLRSTTDISVDRGITFPATQVPSANTNCLDDYEEQSFTPIDVSGAGLAFVSAGGTYTKVGRLVTYSLQVQYPATASGANVAIGGLPFTAAANNYGGVQCFGVQRMWIHPASTAQIQALDPATSAAITNIQLSGTIVLVVGHYEV